MLTDANSKSASLPCLRGAVERGHWTLSQGKSRQEQETNARSKCHSQIHFYRPAFLESTVATNLFLRIV
jgi:hypothetical protein